jgi:threonine dehydrogenase-like Zn-dependent dehydrogenase
MLIGGFDLTYDCVGSGPGLSDAMKWTRPRGTVVAVGTSQIGVVDSTPLWFTELNLVGCNGRAIEEVDGRKLHTYELVFDWLRAGRLKLDGLLTHRFRLADYRAAFQTIATRGRAGLIKAAFVPD